ncbi:peflin isoform X2 [Schistocerca serialis cubense]|uniref:peflin isoform X2 n=1 Tax=Schistocerca serialis cubense TaxID=2023355 RepID=UPI00214E35C0|nr:peflin isoform X2 [Schistocerca serialis cubense]
MSYPNLSYAGYGGAQPNSGYPGNTGYPGQQAPSSAGYPGQQAPSSAGYPGQQAPGSYSGGAGYPNAQQPYAGGQPQAGFGGQPSNYGSYPGGYDGVSPEVQQWFNAVDVDRSGKISAKELQAALVNGQGKNFSETACALMIGMFDQDKSGTIDVKEFQLLYNYINQWLATFRSYDKDGSGSIEEHELNQALQQMGFRFSPDFVKFLIQRSDPREHKRITVDQFIVICVQIQRFTEAFRARDKEMRGVITIGFEDFLGLALSCSV